MSRHITFQESVFPYGKDPTGQKLHNSSTELPLVGIGGDEEFQGIMSDPQLPDSAVMVHDDHIEGSQESEIQTSIQPEIQAPAGERIPMVASRHAMRIRMPARLHDYQCGILPSRNPNPTACQFTKYLIC